MSTRTPRFGLNAFGGPASGSLSDDGMKFTYGDRMLLDRLLSALERNDLHFTPGAVVPDPVGLPTATVQTGGVLPAGRTFNYVVSFVGTDGLETLIGDEVTISTPAILAPPDAPQLESAAGGVLAPGLYYYALTGIRGPEETTLSGIATGTLVAGEGSMILTLPALGDADELQVWRRGFSEGGFTRIGTTTTTTFTDDGSVPADDCACDPSKQPPRSNRGVNQYSVQITLSAEDAAVVTGGGVQAWRLYRTEQAGVYSSTSLVHEAVETTDEMNPDSPLVTSWTDDGDPLLGGQPVEVSQRMHLQPYAVQRDVALPDPTGWPDGFPLVVDGALYVLLDGTWIQIGPTPPAPVVFAVLAALPDETETANYTEGAPVVVGSTLYVLVAGVWTPVGGGGGGGTSPGAPWPDYIFTGADGRRWRQSVDATGALVMTETQLPGAPTPPTNLQVS